MKAFAALYRELDATTSSLAKQAALQRYLQSAAPAERLDTSHSCSWRW